MRWSIGRRLEQIEYRLHWDGRLKRRDLVDMFGVSPQQASSDIARYDKLAPGNMVFDPSSKTYFRAPEFKPLLIDPGASVYLNELRLVAEGVPHESWIGDPPAVGLLPIQARSVDWRRLRDILSAIRNNEAIEIQYQSFSRAELEWRWIAPHALGFDGIRWHARAWCLRSLTFKDFSLARMHGSRGAKAIAINPKDDKDWNEDVDIVVVADPSLTAAQRKAVEIEYGMKEGKLKFTVKRAFLLYALRRLGLDVPESARPAGARRLKLLDRARIAAMAGVDTQDADRIAKVL